MIAVKHWLVQFGKHLCNDVKPCSGLLKDGALPGKLTKKCPLFLAWDWPQFRPQSQCWELHCQEMALAMAWRSSLALARQMWALGGRVLLGKLTRSPDPGVKKSAMDSSLKQMMGASLPREPVTGALEIAWRSTQCRDIQFWALRRLEICREVQQKRLRNSHIFGTKTSIFCDFLGTAKLSMVLGSSMKCFTQSWACWGRGLDQHHFQSKNSRLALWIILLVLMVLLAWKCNFEALIWIYTQPIN